MLQVFSGFLAITRHLPECNFFSGVKSPYQSHTFVHNYITIPYTITYINLALLASKCNTFLQQKLASKFRQIDTSFTTLEIALLADSALT